MTEREQLLDYISRMKTKAEIAAVYGDNWKEEEYRLRRSHTAGELCLLFLHLERISEKANRRPKSKGARKAQRELTAGCRELLRLSEIVTESRTDFDPAEVRYLSEPLHTVTYNCESRIKIQKKPLEIRMPLSVT